MNSMERRIAMQKSSKAQAVDRSLHPVVGSLNSETPRVTAVLAGMVDPLAKANSSAEFIAALKAALQRLIEEARKLERENVRQDKMLESVFVLACERGQRGRVDKELYSCLGIDLDRKFRTSNSKRSGPPADAACSDKERSDP